jgi:hypothetical protein
MIIIVIDIINEGDSGMTQILEKVGLVIQGFFQGERRLPCE